MATKKKRSELKCAVVGASGYAGLETLKILSRHPSAHIVMATSDTYSGKPVKSQFPYIDLPDELVFQPHEDAIGFKDADVFFLSLPHGKSYDFVGVFPSSAKIVDISADFRLKNPADYEKWYDYVHPLPELLKSAVYGLSEIYRKEIKSARLVANPGCYPTSIGLALHPLSGMKEYVRGPIIIDSKSGYSGAGRSPKTNLLFCEAANDFSAYKVTGHRHTPEMTAEAENALGWLPPLTFTPHLLPVARGILSTICVPLQGEIGIDRIHAIYSSFYRGETFVKVLDRDALPCIKHVAGTNLCKMNVFLDEENNILKIVSVIDNLVKGAAGQAVQNMNIMFGLPEDSGLIFDPVLP